MRHYTYHEERNLDAYVSAIDTFAESRYMTSDRDVSRPPNLKVRWGSQQWSGRYAVLVEYCHRMKRKYEQAAAHPWRAVVPDPPDL